MKNLSFLMLITWTFLVPGLSFAQTTTSIATNNLPAAVSNGIKLYDPNRGMQVIAPNEAWSINAGKHSISLNHETYYDAHVTIKKSWYTVSTAQEAYDKRKESLKSYLPGAIFIKENEAVQLAGNVTGYSMIYKNPSDLKVNREIMFVHKGQAYELVFQAKDENFQTVKQDFGFILQNFSLF